ncbi:MAG: PhzF family phenazine biosynthesis protein [Myxococcaceae bacterium]|nr:PhzF family phenazine biosynthesis protein [Myxococcaceae bacterium]
MIVERRADLFVLTSKQAWVKDQVAEAVSLYAALGVRSDRVRRAQAASIGSAKAIVELSDVEELQALRPASRDLSDWSFAHGINGAYVYARDAAGQIYARAFNPLSGVIEDAATGVAAGALAQALDHPYDRWLTVFQIPSHAPRCELHARRLASGETEVGGRAHRAM